MLQEGGVEEFVEQLVATTPAPGLPDNLTTEELYRWVRKDPEGRYLEKYIQAGRIPGAFKMGKEWLFRRVEIELNILKTGKLFLPPKKRKGSH